MALTQIKSGAIADDAIDSSTFADGSIDNAHLAANSVDSDQYVDGSIDNAHLADDAVDSDELAAGSVDIAHLAAGTDGKIITWDANGAAAVVGPGTDGQVLTSTGAGSPPAFEDAAASGATLSGSTDNTVVTVTGANAMQGESNVHVVGGKLIVGATTSTSEAWQANIQSIGSEALTLGRAATAHQCSEFAMVKTRNATWGNNTIVADDDLLGIINFYGDDGTDYKTSAASINAAVDGTPAVNNMPGRLTFNTKAADANTYERMRIDSSGNVIFSENGIIPNSVYGGAAFRADSYGRSTLKTSAITSTSVPLIILSNSNGEIGSIATSGSTTTYNTSSDYRLKENVVDIADGITRVKQLQPRRFNFITDADTTVDGFVAHEAQTVVPEAITGEKDAMKDEEYEVTPAVEASEGVDAVPAVMDTRSVPDYQGIDQSKLVPLLTAALQEAITKIETLETKVAALEAA